MLTCQGGILCFLFFCFVKFQQCFVDWKKLNPTFNQHEGVSVTCLHTALRLTSCYTGESRAKPPKELPWRLSSRKNGFIIPLLVDICINDTFIFRSASTLLLRFKELLNRGGDCINVLHMSSSWGFICKNAPCLVLLYFELSLEIVSLSLSLIHKKDWA